MTLERLGWPESWQSVPLWSLFRRVKDVGHPDEEMLSVYRDHGVVQKDSRADNFNKTAENRNIYQLVDVGWLIVNRMKAWQGSLGISPHRGIVSGHYICFRPAHNECPKFLDYLLRSNIYAAELRQLSRGVRPNQIEIDNDWLRVLPVFLPPLGVQRAIADYLDAETARIDALIEKKRRMVELLEEARVSAVDATLWIGRTIELKYVADILPGFAFQSEEFSDEGEGPALIRGTNVGVGEIGTDDQVRLNDASSGLARYRLRVGDVLVGMDRPFISGGTRVAIVDPASEGALLVQWVCRLRFSDLRSGVIVGHALASPRFPAFIEPDLTGVSVPHLSDEQIGNYRVPEIAARPTDAILELLDRRRKSSLKVEQCIRRQMDLLIEHRQALVTAAVTGELSIPGAAA